MIKALLLSHFPWQPTSQQEEVLARIAEFLHTFSTESCFILRGYAGTGKTTIISTLVKALPSIRKRTVLLAPTCRAAKVIGNYSCRQVLTFHKNICLKKNAATMQIDFELAANLHTDTLFIVVEASIISDEGVT